MLSQLIVTGGDAAELLDPAEEALDQVTIFVKMLVERPLHQAITARRNHCLDVRRIQIRDD